jgi:CBS domain containing-hemolysin-like protein
MKDTFRKSIKWSTSIAVITLVLAAIFSIISTLLLSGVAWMMGIVIVLAIVCTGIFFDVIGVAATASNEVPFHAMASEKVHGAKQAIKICRNADRVASFCNDVIGDISGIISGTASAAVIIQLSFVIGSGEGSAVQNTISIIFTGIIAALTVGGKAFGKTFAINYSTQIIFQVGRLIYLIEEKLKITVFSDRSSNRTKQRKRG